jgi:hypothetical protein
MNRSKLRQRGEPGWFQAAAGAASNMGTRARKRRSAEMWTFAQILNDFYKDKIKTSGKLIGFAVNGLAIAGAMTSLSERQ